MTLRPFALEESGKPLPHRDPPPLPLPLLRSPAHLAAGLPHLPIEDTMTTFDQLEVRLTGTFDDELRVTQWTDPDGAVVVRFAIHDVVSHPEVDDYPSAGVDVPVEDLLPLLAALSGAYGRAITPEAS